MMPNALSGGKSGRTHDMNGRQLLLNNNYNKNVMTSDITTSIMNIKMN
jgi:hypothetical protein